jgi:putative tricarboxylic transport membrane protein
MEKFKANPGSVSWGGGSAGGTDHILAGLMAKAVGVDPSKVNYVPFKGGGEAVAAIIGGHVTRRDLGALRIRAAHQVGQDARARRVLAQGHGRASRRSRSRASTSSSPTGAASSARPGITKAQRDELIAALEKATKSKEWQESLKKNDWEGYWLAGDAYAGYIDAENKRLGDILGALSLGKK